jgi:hypothetical protein
MEVRVNVSEGEPKKGESHSKRQGRVSVHVSSGQILLLL